jgi:TonB family protein
MPCHRAKRIAQSALAAAFITNCLWAADLKIPEAQAKHSAINKPVPAMPAMARSMKIGGHVEVEVSIDTSGSVTDVKPVQGPPVLSMSVVQTVKTWKFTPFTDESGAPSTAVTALSFDFKP